MRRSVLFFPPPSRNDGCLDFSLRSENDGFFLGPYIIHYHRYDHDVTTIQVTIHIVIIVGVAMALVVIIVAIVVVVVMASPSPASNPTRPPTLRTKVPYFNRNTSSTPSGMALIKSQGETEKSHQGDCRCV